MATSIPSRYLGISAQSIPSFAAWTSSTRLAPSTAGLEIRKENFTAKRRSSPVAIPAVIVVPERLRLAKELGATHTLNGREVSDIPAAVRALTDGFGVQYAVDCTGSGECVRTSLICVRPLGTCAVVGATQELTIHVENELMGAAKTLGGVVEGCCVPQLFIPQLVEFYRRGRFPFDRLVRFYPFGEINRAFADTKAGKVVKAVLTMA